MAKATSSSGWLRGRVKAVLSGDTLVVMGLAKAADEIPPERTIVLAHLVTPRLARRGGKDEPFAWESREFLRYLCIGQDVVFRTEYTIPNTSRECCSVFIDSTNIAKEIVTHGWAKVREARRRVTPEHDELLRLEKQAKQQQLGLWNKSPVAIKAAIRNLPPSAVGNPKFDAKAFFDANKGTPMEAIVEHVHDGNCLYAYLLPDYQFVKVFVAGIQAPSMRRRLIDESSTSSASTDNEVSPDRYGREAKHFTEIRILSRDVWIVLEGVDKFNNLVGSVYYTDGDEDKDLALELIENGFAKYVEWSASMMEDEARWNLKDAELEAKKNKLRMWTDYVIPATNSKAISKNFTGKVIEVVSGDCIVVSDDSVPFGSPGSEIRVNLSSIRCPKLGNPRRDVQPDRYAREAKEFLRARLIGRQVQVSMEYSRRVPTANGSTDPNGTTDTRVMSFGSVFELSQGKDSEDVPSAGGQQPGVNVAELIISRGFGTVIEHRDFEERSHYYRNLLAAQSRATDSKRGIHSSENPPVMRVKDLTMASPKKAKGYLPSLQRYRRMAATVECVLSGHRFKLFVPKATCSIAFSLSGIRCPAREEPYSDEAFALMRRKLLQRDVEIEVETVDKNGTFLGSLWVSKTNVGVTHLEEKDLALELIQNGFAKYVEWSASNMQVEARRKLKAAELEAKKNKLRIWTDYVPPATNPKEISNNFTATNPKAISNSFTGKVIEVVSGDCIIVADDSVPFGSPAAEKRVNLSSIKCPKMGNPRRNEKPDPYAREAWDLLRRRLIGHQVLVSMEYSRRVPTANGSTDPNGTTETQGMGSGSVFLLSQGKDSDDVSSAGGQQPGLNVAQLIISHGLGTVIKHRDNNKERSHYYEILLAEESRAKPRGKGIHSSKDPSVMHVNDLTTASPKEAKEYLPCLQRNRRMAAIVENVLSGHRFKLFVPKEACVIAFSLSGVRCPGRKEPYSDEAISLMRMKLMQRDVEIEVESVDRNGTFLGSLWESNTNAGVTLLEAGLARLETTDKITDAQLLGEAEQLARKQNLKIWGEQVQETSCDINSDGRKAKN